MRFCVIPARGGSKRIPRKNLRSFRGSPIIGWSIEAARQCNLFDDVIVSTEDEEIAEVAKYFGATVPFVRPQKLSDDDTPSTEVIKHAAGFICKDTGSMNHELCCLYATAPLITTSDLIDSYRVFSNGFHDYVFSAAKFSSPPQRGFTWDGSKVSLLFPELQRERSQDLSDIFHDAGQFYWGSLSAWVEEKPIFGGSSAPFILDRIKVQDIDTPDDWEFAEILSLVKEHHRR